MINLKSISIKNFLSYGNVPTVLKLDEYRNTLIASSSGSGKSVFVDAICYALYGKPYRNIKLGQMINSINLKGMLVTIEFNIGSIEYKVIRGMKPGVFQIYQDGKLLDQEAATRDYQGFLETAILKINYKTFCQVVLIGTAGFTPFMQLPAGQRRDVIEDVLDIAIFSEMNVILKQRILEVRDSLVDVNHKLENAKKDTANQVKIIKLMEEHQNDRIVLLESDNCLLTESILGYEGEIAANDRKIEEQLAKKQKPTLDNSRGMFALEDEKSRLEKKLETVDSMESCPTCLQCVTTAHKKTTKKQLGDDLKIVLGKLVNVYAHQELYQTIDSANREIDSECGGIRQNTISLQSLIRRDTATLAKNRDSISDLKQSTTGIKDEKAKLKGFADNALALIDRKNTLLQERSIQEVVAGLLKDSGIKSAIIREYIPILNRLINKYLAEFGFFINFTLDENFNEKILSRGRDEFSYNSFSEGEKTKIDLSILFAFRQITELKNSANCNLLFLDECGDSHLDVTSKEAFVNILSQLENGNNFVISHNAPDNSIYDQVIKIEKKNDFSLLEYI
jgi:DNA repair exonuclease SbcCD ATPase subunit